MAPSHRSRNGGDRLSALPDKALERVLSHLMSDEAVRTSGLSRRWRHVHEGVPVVHLVDTKSGDRYGRSGGKLKVCFDHQVTSAIMGKTAATPIQPPYDLLDQWIPTVVNSSVEDLDVKLRYCSDSMGTLCPFLRCPILGTKHSADFDAHDRNSYTRTQPHIFGCPTLRRLRLTNWTLNLPGSVDMASLETLCLARIMDPHGALQQLISACPGLANLTLEECPSIQEIAVTPARLRRFAMICCHNATSVELQTTCLQSLHYKGGLPARDSSFITVADSNYAGIMALKIEICGKLTRAKPEDVAPVARLVRKCTKRTYLHLSLRPSMACNLFTSVLRGLDSLTHMSLQGCLPTDDAVLSVSTLLAEAKNLEVLSLFPLGPEPPKIKRKRMHRNNDDDKSDSDSEPEDSPVDDGVKYSSRMPKRLKNTYVRCLAKKVRRISIANFEGRPLEKMLARFLLSRAAELEEFTVTLADRVNPQQDEDEDEDEDEESTVKPADKVRPRKDEIAKELRSWRCNRGTRVICK
ncbi:F-box/LRR-repeat protein [Hordeum vulgare]|uniref:F-box domain-containing protein n=1 Tax=Hordeum vulgare subsp. vulgare TaxID=112509 RepID=A0A8I7B872_HORVV|nr:F-box/LRR-repeat protein [Hordeum vulgare]